MKDKIMMLVLGILVGAVITAGCFLIFSKNANSRGEEKGQRGEKPEMGNFVPGDKPQGIPDGDSIEDTNTANS